MPIAAQGAVDQPISLDVRNGTGDYTDPTNLSLTFRNSLGVVQSGFPITYPGAIIKDAVGRYHYDYDVPLSLPTGTYTALWEGILNGAPTEAQETWEIVATGSMSVGGLDFLIDPDDYEGVRGLLGVTTLDVENSDILRPVFGPHAELLVKQRISNWAIQMTDPDSLFMLRLATVYKTACLMAESWVRGGTIGLARPLSTGEGRDWAEAAQQFCQGYEYWINIVDQADDALSSTAIYTIHPMRVSGPTAVRLAHRRAGTAIRPEDEPWFVYPPFWKST